MAINKKLIHFKKYETFNGSQGINGATEPTNGMYGNIPEHSIVFILDVKKIWTHGQLYDCDLSALEELGLIKALIEEILNTLKKEDPYWEYYEYEHVPLTIEALGDGTIEFQPHIPNNVIEGSLDGGKTWVSITNNPIQLVSGDKLLLKGSVAGSLDPATDGGSRNCGNLVTQFPYNAFGNPTKLLRKNPIVGDVDYEYVFSALLSILSEQTGLVMHKLFEQNIEGFETLSFKEKVIAILSMLAGYDPSEEELLYFVSSLLQQFGTVSFLDAISAICNFLQPNFPDLNVDKDFLSETIKTEYGEDATLHDCVAGLYKMMIGVEKSYEERPGATFYNFLSNNIVSAENLYLDEYTSLILLESPTLQIAPKVIDLRRYPQDTQFSRAFSKCTALTKAPELPATELSEGCYNGMFWGCTSLTEAPKLPATELSARCYKEMFYNCSTLQSAPELPALILADNCYEKMFFGCSELILAPKLPAVELTRWCYAGMFSWCNRITTAPELLASILAERCYFNMFEGCENLNYIKMLVKNTSYLGSGLSDWVHQVATEGTFVKSKGMDLPTGDDGIPEGWTVEEYVSPEDQLKELQVSVDSNTEALSNKANINGDWNENFKADLLEATELNVGSIRFEDSGEYPYIDFNGINYANGEIIFFPEYNELMQSSTLATLDDVSGKASKSELENYLPKSGGSLTGNLHVGNVTLYNGDENWNGGIDLVSGSIEASEVNDFSYVQDSQGNNLLEVLDTKTGIYYTEFTIAQVVARNDSVPSINITSLTEAVNRGDTVVIPIGNGDTGHVPATSVELGTNGYTYIHVVIPMELSVSIRHNTVASITFDSEGVLDEIIWDDLVTLRELNSVKSYVTDFTLTECSGTYDLAALADAVTKNKTIIIPWGGEWTGYSVVNNVTIDDDYITLFCHLNAERNPLSIHSGEVYINLDRAGGYVDELLTYSGQLLLEDGFNIKTINGESVLGSGNIEISGGGTKYMGVNSYTQSGLDLQPNHYYNLSESNSSHIDTLNIGFYPPAAGMLGEYTFEFLCQAGAEITFPSTLSWVGGEPTFEEDARYIVSIVMSEEQDTFVGVATKIG